MVSYCAKIKKSLPILCRTYRSLFLAVKSYSSAYESSSKVKELTIYSSSQDTFGGKLKRRGNVCVLEDVRLLNKQKQFMAVVAQSLG